MAEVDAALRFHLGLRWRCSRLQEDLEALLGRRVEVVTEGGLSPYLRDRILAEAVGL